MPWLEAHSDPRELRRCIRDLVALSTLPTLWKTFDLLEIGDSVAAALVSMLAADFVHIAIPGGREQLPVEVTRTGPGLADVRESEIRAALRGVPSGDQREAIASIAHPRGSGALHVACAPIGSGRQAVLVAGSHHPDFPTDAHRLLLSVAADQTSAAMQRWRLESEERRFFALVDRCSDFVGFATLDGRPQYLNPSGRQLVGLTLSDELSRFHILDFLVPEERHRGQVIGPIAMRTGRWTGEIGFRNFKTAETVPMLLDWFRIDDPRSGRPMNIAAVARDLRAQKRSEADLHELNETLERRVLQRTTELGDANQRLIAEMMQREQADVRLQELRLELFHATRLSTAGQMAAALAHELNQPLTAILNSISAARRLLGQDDPASIGIVSEIVGEAAEQALHAGEIIRRQRAFVRAGKVGKLVENVGTMLEEASALALTGTEAWGVEVGFHLDPRASRVLADRVQIQQVLVNLIRNALDAMVGSRRRELRLETVLLDEKTIEIAVADSGHGLAEEIVEHLFEPFVSTRLEGMGLGLSICRSIVAAHGGRIVAEADPSGGTIFRFTLPAVRDAS